MVSSMFSHRNVESSRAVFRRRMRPNRFAASLLKGMSQPQSGRMRRASNEASALNRCIGPLPSLLCVTGLSTSIWFSPMPYATATSVSDKLLRANYTVDSEQPMPDSNLEQLITAAKLLRPLLDDLVFVGGSVTGLLITDEAAWDPRATLDVDAIAQITSYAEYSAFGNRLPTLGFTEGTR